MSELRRLAGHRFVGVRDTMIVYDTEDRAQRSALVARLGTDDLVARDLVQTFGPDTLPEAGNRGFKPAGDGT